ncbi:MAG: ABC transporter ATP-binding protein [Deltaproteobacteria bacterium]|jgi:iron(III) transport system ATP-binding protein|nr:ABC transporter ATP-binding protein [Deltaproteobacteria bacterium]
MATIHLDAVSKAYGSHQVLRELTLDIRHGECFTLLGPSGCGKTVLLRLIAGFELPDAGRIRIGETLVSEPASRTALPPDRRDLGVVFQDYAVWPHMNVFDNVAYPLKIAKIGPTELRERTMESIALVNMTGLEQRLPSELSGGQQQRVALARALTAKPSLMLLDEPLSNLDANLREEMRFEIKELQSKLDMTVLYVTHDQEIALAISDRLAVLDAKGAIRQIGTPWEIFERPVDSFVFNFMGIANFLPVRHEASQYYVGQGTQCVPWATMPVDPSREWLAAFRPSDVRIARLEEGAPPADALRGVVRRASFLGAMMDYLVDIDGAHLRTALETHEAITQGLVFREGEPCAVSFRSLHWFDAQSAAEAES